MFQVMLVRLPEGTVFDDMPVSHVTRIEHFTYHRLIHILRVRSRSLVSEPPVGSKTGSINAVSLSRVAAQAQTRVSPTKFSLNGGGISIITIWLFNSSPWKDPPIFKNGKPSISMGHRKTMAMLVTTIINHHSPSFTIINHEKIP